MKKLIEKLRNYNRWRRGDETAPQPHPQEVGEMIDQAIEALEGVGGGLRILNDELSLQSVGWTDIRKMLKKVQSICRFHELGWIDVQHKSFWMMVEPDSDIELLADEFEEWEKKKEAGHVH